MPCARIIACTQRSMPKATQELYAGPWQADAEPLAEEVAVPVDGGDGRAVGGAVLVLHRVQRHQAGPRSPVVVERVVGRGPGQGQAEPSGHLLDELPAALLVFGGAVLGAEVDHLTHVEPPEAAQAVVVGLVAEAAADRGEPQSVLADVLALQGEQQPVAGRGRQHMAGRLQRQVLGRAAGGQTVERLRAEPTGGDAEMGKVAEEVESRKTVDGQQGRPHDLGGGEPRGEAGQQIVQAPQQGGADRVQRDQPGTGTLQRDTRQGRDAGCFHETASFSVWAGKRDAPRAYGPHRRGVGGPEQARDRPEYG